MPGRHLRRDLRLQPRRLVRRRGARQRRSATAQLGNAVAGAFDADAEAAGAELPARRGAGASGSRTSYLDAFEDAAARYELGRRGVWALAAVARLESNFGRGMDEGGAAAAAARSASTAPSGSAYAVDGDGDGRHPPRRPRRLRRDPGAADLVARRPARRPLQPQPGRVVRGGGARRGRAARRQLRDAARSTGRWRCPTP